MDSKIRIIVADDHAVVREGIRIWLERDPRVEVVATAADTQSLADQIDNFPCEVVISDIGMRGINGEKVVNLGVYCALVGMLGAKVLMIALDPEFRTHPVHRR